MARRWRVPGDRPPARRGGATHGSCGPRSRAGPTQRVVPRRRRDPAVAASPGSSARSPSRSTWASSATGRRVQGRRPHPEPDPEPARRGRAVGVVHPRLLPAARRGPARRPNRLAGNVLGLLLAVMAGLVGAGILLAGPLTTVLTPGFSGERLELATTLLRIVFPAIAPLGALGLLHRDPQQPPAVLPVLRRRR